MDLARYSRNFLAADRKLAYLCSKFLLLLGIDLKFVKIEVGSGVRVFAHCSKESLELLLRPDYKREERKFYERFLEGGEICVDVGANIGCFSLIAASQVGPTGKVYSFEPHRSVYSALLDNIRLNNMEGIVEARNVALGDATTTTRLFVRKYSDDFGSLSKAAHQATGSIDVEIQTDEQWEAELTIPVSMENAATDFFDV